MQFKIFFFCIFCIQNVKKKKKGIWDKEQVIASFCLIFPFLSSCFTILMQKMYKSINQEGFGLHSTQILVKIYNNPIIIPCHHLWLQGGNEHKIGSSDHVRCESGHVMRQNGQCHRLLPVTCKPRGDILSPIWTLAAEISHTPDHCVRGF